MSADPRFDGPGPDDIFATALSQGRFVIQRCRACAASRFPPALVCAVCGSADLDWVEASGLGQVYATTIVRERDGAYNVAIVALEEGARMMTRVDGVVPADVRIGLKVRARIATDPTPHVVFAPAEGESR